MSVLDTVGWDETTWSGEWVTDRLGVELTSDVRPLVGLALRHNPRRAHLLVSRVLGKHIPQLPSVVLSAGTDLGRRVYELLGESARQAVVLGYAETATALGHSVADGISAGLSSAAADDRTDAGWQAARPTEAVGVPYLHSTRRPVPSVASAGGFEEEHSHATSHLLLPEDPELLAGTGPLVLVDDELSTGRTVRNTITALHARHPRDRYVLVTLLDMRSERDVAAVAKCAADLGTRVDVVALAAGGIQLPADALTRGQALVAEHSARQESSAATVPRVRGGGLPDVRATAPAVKEATPAAREASRERAVAPAPPIRVALDWPAGLPDGGRHGFTPNHRARLEAVLPDMAVRLATALSAAGVVAADPRGDSASVAPGAEAGGHARDTGGRVRDTSHRPEPPHTPRVLVLGCEELMYVPLRLAHALERRFGQRAEVRFSTTTRSPVLAVDDPAYAIRTRLSFPAHEGPRGPEAGEPQAPLGTHEGHPGERDAHSEERYAYNIAPGTNPDRRFDAVVAVVDSVADTPALHASDGLLAQLTPHTDAVLLAVLPSYVPPPRPLRGPEFSSYRPEDVGWLLQDLSEVELEAPTEEREEAVQRGGAHYAESLPVEYQPTPEYQQLFHAALESSAARIAHAVGTVTETVLAERGPRPVLASLARAGTPVGVLMRRWAQHAHGLEIPHYTLSIVRGRGIDGTALRYLAGHHDPADVVFVDGWTGKGAITRELAEAIRAHPGFAPEVAVLADPGGCVRTYGTREDFLIPSACLNSTVSGLVSRTVLRADLVGPDDFHGAKYYRELAEADLSRHFLDTVAARFDEVRPAVLRDVPALLSADRSPTWVGWRAVERISEEYGINDVNLVKPGVGETTRVLLRRVPWRILARRGAGSDLDHVRLLAEQRGVPVEEIDELPYSCVGLIHPRYTRGATGADGKAVQ
ncbi:phosphoribosyltransferase [Streptomyces oceani]|uniref:Phosphoribosyltransferase n=1 Tax=Streptomyces oceani TaxID=1075402 RepID=A0A1E7KFD0_9ACTN|nr:phosphoribosyltransferase [Streptomyces oceani]OEV02594.1 phosphoribosyltransferase [Streptomyces oceani]